MATGTCWRALRIVLLGLAIQVLSWLIFPGGRMRFPRVLQRIGICFGSAALFASYGGARVLWTAIVVILFGYWGLLLAGGSLEPFVNIASRTDSAIFGRFVYLVDPATGRVHDPEGLLSSLPALATCLLGLRAGQWLRDDRMKPLLVTGVLALVVGCAWSLVLPFNMNLWTSSFVPWTGGWAMLVLALFHGLVDRHGWPAMGRRFGMNAVAAYAGSELIQILLPASGLQNPLYLHAFASWIMPLAGPCVASPGYALAFVAVWWVVVYAMDRRQVYLTL